MADQRLSRTSAFSKSAPGLALRERATALGLQAHVPSPVVVHFALGFGQCSVDATQMTTTVVSVL